jgi:hypothetical protein
MMELVSAYAKRNGYLCLSSSLRGIAEHVPLSRVIPLLPPTDIPSTEEGALNLYRRFQDETIESACDLISRDGWMFIVEAIFEREAIFRRMRVQRTPASPRAKVLLTDLTCLCLPVEGSRRRGDPKRLAESLLRHAIGKGYALEVTSVDFSRVGEDIEKSLRERASLPEAVAPPLLRAYRELLDGGNRGKLIEVKKRPRILPEQDGFLERMARAGMVQREFAVVCTQAPEKPILVFPDKRHLDSFIRTRARCHNCGEIFTKSNSRFEYEISKLGAQAIDGSLWMSWAVVDQLTGITHRWWIGATTPEGDEFDILAIVGDRLVAFELKDSDFDRGDAFKFFSKCTQIRPRHLVVVCTGKVAEPAKQYLDQQRSAYSETPMSVTYIQQVNLGEAGAIREFVTGMYVGRLVWSTQSFTSSLAPFDIDAKEALRNRLSSEFEVSWGVRTALPQGTTPRRLRSTTRRP